ncbi:MAG: arginine--tRNA ligase [Lachnospiraceae bacterium]|nr:arginine--tRNA ligase [Lachnospiraceae bacterium]
MKSLLEQLSAAVSGAFEAAGFDASLGRVTVSNRPDLCEFQCNGAMAGAKQYHRAPLEIAKAAAEKLAGCPLLSEVQVAPPGFLNLKVAPGALAENLKELRDDPHLGAAQVGEGKTLIVDYGGANVAKPLHVGHLRSAIIGEALKRMARGAGFHAIGDVHLGDWGLQMGLVIAELQSRQPELCYFDPNYEGEYPEEAPFTISELEEIYPTASARAKKDPSFSDQAHMYTLALQRGERGIRALWEKILQVSVADLRRNYDNLNVSFEVWNGESDADPYIPGLIERLKEGGFAYESEGALVVDVREETDQKEVPPCIVLKSDGAALYATSDLGTLVQREETNRPDRILYVVDKRQEMHFIQVFRTAKKAGIVRPEVQLDFLGFGTMNGRDGKPFKTRDGGVMRLEVLIRDITEAVLAKMREAGNLPEEEAEEIARVVGLAALKYGDLSNQASKDYVFDVDRFCSFEGDTGPYLLYTVVRIRSILSKAAEKFPEGEEALGPARSAAEKALALLLSRAPEAVSGAWEELAPHKLCQYVYDVSNAFNRFYHETKILAEEDAAVRGGYLALLRLTEQVLTGVIDLLGFSAPERM